MKKEGVIIDIKMTNLSTPTKPTWCPGCWNFQILAGVKNYLESKIKTGGDT